MSFTFDGAVHVDIRGVSGTDYPIGSRELPVNNMHDAQIIMGQRGIYTLNHDIFVNNVDAPVINIDTEDMLLYHFGQPNQSVDLTAENEDDLYLERIGVNYGMEHS